MTSSILPEALKTNCLRCTEKQKTVTLRAIKRLKKEYPKVWVQLQEQWDPDDIFVKKFEASFNTRPIESSPEASVQILNRFGDQTDVEKGVENAISQSIPSTSTSRPTTTITTTKKHP
ncbi:hypothetical protein NQ314_003228 [Rhamnusium bicolor]|uniref:Uncharacterized protein n=1 Tax=Rhamnusium bicolor TaxID=1586634 RepID=A0AAV8ZQY9_9CUCU|nr:hypothetical protein NQ314_003228 [Rhamnusium bicolor]